MKRLTPAKVTLIMFMVVGGLITAYIAKGLMAVPEKKGGPKMRNLPMPISDLPVGTVITEDHLGIGPVLETDLQRDMLLANKVIVGRVVKEKLKGSYPIRSSQLYEPGAYPPLKLAEGMRAVTITSSGMQSIVDGLIKPGDFVDVHFTPSDYRGDDRMRGGLTMTLFKGVKILAINRMMIQGTIERNANSLTLELTEEQANIIILARGRGELTLSLNPHGKGDGRIALADPDRATLEEILGLAPIKKPEAAPAPPPPFISQIYRGIRRQEIRFEKNGTVREMGGANALIPAPAPAPAQTPGVAPTAPPQATSNDPSANAPSSDPSAPPATPAVPAPPANSLPGNTQNNGGAALPSASAVKNPSSQKYG